MAPENTPQGQVSSPSTFSALDRGVYSLETAVLRFVEEARQNMVQMGDVKSEVRELRSNINQISTILRDGNGQPPVLSRISKLEEFKTSAEVDIRELDARLEKIVHEACAEVKNEMVKWYEERLKREKIAADLERSQSQIGDYRDKAKNRRITIELIIAIAAFAISVYGQFFTR